MTTDVIEGELLDVAPSAALALRSPSSAELGTALAPGTERAQSYAADARAPNTRRTYASQWNGFCAWCETQGRSSLPASGETVAIYLAHLADKPRKASGIALALTAISQMHEVKGEPNPRGDRRVKETWKGIRRTLGTAQQGKHPLYGQGLLTALEALPPTLAGVRDRAMLLLGYTGAFRRGELVGLVVEDLREVPQGLEVTIRRSKTDQEGKGRTIPIPRERIPEVCPVAAVKAWLDASGLTKGPLFRAIHRCGRVLQRGLAPSGHYVAVLVKRAAVAAGLAPGALSGHSLRSGLVTAALDAGRSFAAVRKVTGHASDAMASRYYRNAELFKDTAAGGLLSKAALI